MTREELIDHLQHLEQYTHYSEDAPALREVIEMLKCSEVPNGSDTIYRQAAIDALYKCTDIFINNLPVMVCKSDAYKALAALPSAQPERLTEDDFETIRIHLNAYKEKLCNQHRWKEAEEYQRIIDRISCASAQPDWISCSERLPENDERVLATTAWGEVTIAERVYPSINDTCWFIHDGNTNATIDDVIAWMPLPLPYQAERREE